MFTGIIETTGIVEKVIAEKTNKIFWISSSLSQQLKIDQSVSHDGVCLTVEEINGTSHRVTAIAETLERSSLGYRKTGDIINIERCMQLNGRMDGHIVQGHVDTTAICIDKNDLQGSREFRFRFDEKYAALIIEKGSICVNGISLTIFNINKNEFTVAIIPYTYAHTNISAIEINSVVNIEFLIWWEKIH